MAEGDRGGHGRENHARLSGCPGPHRFRREARVRFDAPPIYRCTRCGGTAAASQVQFCLGGLRRMRALMRREQAGADAIGAEPVLMGR